MMDMMLAGVVMMLECARTMGRANPVTTKPAVKNLPRSTGPEFSYELDENSSEPQ
jgi:hypothetical protein